MDIQPVPGFTHPVSSLTHLIGAGVFALLAVPLWRRCGGCRLCRITTAVFSFTVVLLLSMSGVYHLLATEGTAHEVFLRLDHAAIFALIAGSFTPLQPLFFRSGWGRWGVLALVWSLAIAGIALKVTFFDAIPEALGLSLYLGLGWLGLGSGIALGRRHGFRFIAPLVWGGLAYTLGAVADFARWPTLVPGVVAPHAVMHLGVLGGIGCFWWFFYSRLPQRHPARKPLVMG
ncbi:hemolysin III [Methylomarinovum tepidoasis]|uniref:Hemolysin III n=1 Tax=Methylomarinovum tepidoasis TaxID=2840183 RepID=A0AAU9C468_9GAMM|nr:hemolysin III family protein [Methylomarinovum sp. IN45]BCX87904.1 hemolysin III [Methylomarinovum sp. IN45]